MTMTTRFCAVLVIGGLSLLIGCASMPDASTNHDLVVTTTVEGYEDLHLQPGMSRKELMALVGSPDKAESAGQAPDRPSGVVMRRYSYTELGLTFIIETARVKQIVVTSPLAVISNGLSIGMPSRQAIELLGPWYATPSPGVYQYNSLDIGM